MWLPVLLQSKDKKPRALSKEDLEQENFLQETTESLDTDQPEACVAQAVLHDSKSTWVENTSPVVKI